MELGQTEHIFPLKWNTVQNGRYMPWIDRALEITVIPFWSYGFMSDARVVEFGKRVRELRKAQGLSQEAFADLVGIDRAYMGHIERGSHNVTIVKVFQISDALNVNPSNLFLGIE